MTECKTGLFNSALPHDRITRELGLSGTDSQALHLLVKREPVWALQDLGEATGMATSTVTRVLDWLEEAGYVRRTSTTHDRRRVKLGLAAEKVGALIDRYARRSPRRKCSGASPRSSASIWATLRPRRRRPCTASASIGTHGTAPLWECRGAHVLPRRTPHRPSQH